MSQNSVTIARAAYQAYADKNRSVIEALIADDFHFTSPLDNRIDRATYFARCWPNSERIAHYDFVRILPAGDAVFVTYEVEIINGQRFRNSEVLTICDGKIVEVEVYFGWDIPHQATTGGFVN